MEANDPTPGHACGAMDGISLVNGTREEDERHSQGETESEAEDINEYSGNKICGKTTTDVWNEENDVCISECQKSPKTP